MNIIHLAGHLGADPEVRFTSSGQKVTTLRLATKARKSGKDETIWWRITVWGEQYDKMISYLKKGSALIVVGDLQKPEIYTDREGNPQMSMNVTATTLMFSPFGKSSQEGFENKKEIKEEPVQEFAKKEEYSGFSSGEKAPSNQTDDDIPF